jgi:hypothetical protein
VTTISLTAPSLHPSQREVFYNESRFRVLVAGRRFGKSKLAALETVKVLTQGGIAWWVSPTFDLSKRVGWKSILQLLKPLIRAGYAEINKTDLTVKLPNGGELQAKSADHPDKLVGEGLDLVVMDECGIIHPDAWYESLRPTLTDTGGRALLIGTPKGRNWFWSEYRKGLDPLNTDYACWSFPTSANPFIPDVETELENARRELPESTFRQEYLAEFLEDSGSVFRNVTSCLRTQNWTGEPVVMGVDWGRHNDFTVIVVMGRNSKQVYEIDRFNQIGWELQRGRLAVLADRWKPQMILAESNSIGEPNIEALQRQGLPVQPFTTTNASKAGIIEGLALAIEKQELGFDDKQEHISVMIGELQAYEMERLPSGVFRYGAPDGSHDDTVIALALALRAAATGRASFISQPEELLEWRG